MNSSEMVHRLNCVIKAARYTLT